MSQASYDDLRRVIHAVRRRWRLKIALRGAAAVVGVGLVALAASAYALDHFRYEPWAVTSFRLFAYVTLLALAARFLVVPLWGRVSEERVALYVEEHEPSLQAAVLSAVEVGPRVAERPDISPALVERLIENAIEKCQTIDYGRHVEGQGLRRASGLLAAVAAAGMVATILSPAFLRHAAPFLLAPWSVRAASPYSIDVDPGNATVPRGGNQAVTARLSGFDAEKAELAVRSGAAGDWKRWPMTAESGTGAFRFVLFALDAASDYYVEASGVRSSVFRLDVADIPYVKRVDLEYHFPAYTGLPPQAVPDTGDVAALAGTEVRVRVTPTMKVPAARLQVDGAEPRAMEVAPDGALTAAFEVQKEGFYRVELAGRDGRLQTGSPDYTIDVLKDQPPTVSFTRPGRDTKVTSIEEVFTEMKAEDDFGVAKAELVYSVNGGPEKTLALHQGRARKSVSAGHTFFLEELSLEPGDFISYFARAADESPAHQTATTDIYFMEVRPFGKEYRQAEERGQGAGGGADAALSFQQRQIIAATFKLVRDRARVPGTQWGQDVATLALMQGRLHDQVQSLVRRMADRGVAEPGSGFAKTSDALRAATVQMASAKGQLETKKAKEALTPEQAALKHLQRAEAAFREVQVSFGDGGGQGGSSAANAEELANLFELELDKLKNQYETVQRGQQQQTADQVDEALERLRQLAQRQEQEAERQRQLAGRPPNMSGGGGGGSQRALAQETEDLARKLERLAREKSNPALSDTARRLQDAANAMRRSSAGGQSGSAGDAAAALERLREARRRLEGERTGRLDHGMQDAVRAAEALAEAQQKVASDVDKELGAPGAGGESGRMDRLMERKGEMEGQVGELEGQLERMAREARGDKKDAARKLQEAADTIRDRKLKDKIRYSKGVMKAHAAEQARQLEGEIGSDLDALRRKVKDAAAAAGGSDEAKRTAALERMRDLVRGLESAQERIGQGRGARGDDKGTRAGQQQGGQGGQDGRGRAQEAREGARDGRAGGQGSGMPGFIGADDARQLRRELRERLRDAEALGRELGGLGPPQPGPAGQAGAARSLNEVLREMRRFEDDRLYGEPRGLATLMASVIDGLKSVEFAMRREAEGPDREKVFLTGSQDLPRGWQALVEEYYRSLSRKPAE